MDRIATLMFGIVLTLGDPRCEARKMEVSVSSSMEQDINEIVKLVFSANAAHPGNGWIYLVRQFI